ncbi:hypothetical protein BHM03_00059722 [Ensete ventricosum]|nr:hypothetical protein BHM03_00059722 [Ensete ventricosum]
MLRHFVYLFTSHYKYVRFLLRLLWFLPALLALLRRLILDCAGPSRSRRDPCRRRPEPGRKLPPISPEPWLPADTWPTPLLPPPRRTPPTSLASAPPPAPSPSRRSRAPPFPLKIPAFVAKWLLLTYLSELLAERQKLSPFVPVLPHCYRLLNQGSSSGLIVKKTIRVDIPIGQFPTEEMMRGKPGYEHLNEPLHILVEAELPAEIVDSRLMQAREILEDLLKPVEESQDFFKKQQLRELAMINGTLREEGGHMSGSVSPFHNSLSMKRAKTRE